MSLNRSRSIAIKAMLLSASGRGREPLLEQLEEGGAIPQTGQASRWRSVSIFSNASWRETMLSNTVRQMKIVLTYSTRDEDRQGGVHDVGARRAARCVNGTQVKLIWPIVMNGRLALRDEMPAM